MLSDNGPVGAPVGSADAPVIGFNHIGLINTPNPITSAEQAASAGIDLFGVAGVVGSPPPPPKVATGASWGVHVAKNEPKSLGRYNANLDKYSQMRKDMQMETDNFIKCSLKEDAERRVSYLSPDELLPENAEQVLDDFERYFLRSVASRVASSAAKFSSKRFVEKMTEAGMLTRNRRISATLGNAAFLPPPERLVDEAKLAFQKALRARLASNP